MEYQVEIEYPQEKMLQNRARAEAWMRFGYADRVGVLIVVNLRYVLWARGVSHKEFCRDPKTQLYHQLLNAKWGIENVPDDRCCGPFFGFAPYLGGGGLHAPGAFGAPILFLDDEPPATVPLLKRPEEIDRLEVPGPADNLNGELTRWYLEMKEAAKDASLVFNGEEFPVQVGIGGIESPFTAAVQMVGPAFYEWLYEYPRACHLLLRKIAQANQIWEEHCRGLMATGPAPPVKWSDADAACQVSSQMFREFVLTYLLEDFGEARFRHLHMCGQGNHLLELLRDEVRVTSLDFGYPLDLHRVKEVLGGRMWLQGNVDPILIQNGSREEIIAAATRCLETLAPQGGFVLSDGANLTPATPLEKAAYLVEAAVAYGRPKGELPTAPLIADRSTFYQWGWGAPYAVGEAISPPRLEGLPLAG